jgi:hypothetical protein
MEIPNKYRIRSHIWFEADVSYSEAFNCLSKSGIKTLIRCLQKRKFEKVKQNGKYKYVPTDDGFVFPYAEAAELGIAKATQHWKNLNKLIAVGFLDSVHQGGWYQKKERDKDYSVYKYSERWRKYGKLDFIKVEKKKALPAHFHIRANIARKELKATSQKRSEQLHKSEGDGIKSANCRFHECEGDKATMENRQTLMNS